MADAERDDGRPDVEDAVEETRTETEEFISLVGHLYRGEMDRTTMWRSRLDRTTNWAVILVASLLTFAFSADRAHFVLLIAMAMLYVFFHIEARRYRAFDVYRSRLRILEKHVFANIFQEKREEPKRWCRRVGDHLRDPEVTMPRLESLQHRLRHVYGPLFAILLIAWLAGLGTFTDPAASVDGATLGNIPGTITLAVVGLFYAGLLVVAFVPWPERSEAFRGTAEGSAGVED